MSDNKQSVPERMSAEADQVDSPRSDAEQNAAPDSTEQYCSSCGDIIKKEAEICPGCGVRQSDASDAAKSEPSKNRTMAAVLALCLGGAGAHKFYLGQTKTGLLYILFIWTFVPLLLGIYEGVKYVRMSDEEFQQKYLN